jgi:hypothetical protein
VIRALRLVRTDELAAWQVGEAQLEVLIDTPDAARAAATAVGALEATLASGLAGPGLVPWPGQRT